MSVDRAAALELTPVRSARRSWVLGDTWTSFWRSRLLIWATGCLGALVLGNASGSIAMFDPGGISNSFGRVGNVLAAPAVRWDAIYYLQIAHGGYSTARETAFYPLYPLVVRAGSWLTGSPVIAGLAISLAALFVALVLIRRLTELELGARPARLTVQLIAFGPMALFLSATYTEALFLALAAGSFYQARRGRWGSAGALGALASLARPGGVLLFAPFVILFLYGPRADAQPAAVTDWWRPRYRPTASILWSGLILAGGAAFPLYLMLRGFGPFGSVRAQESYTAHQIVFPLVGAWRGLVSGWHQFTLELSGGSQQTQGVFQAATLLLVIVALVGTFRRLPLAYGVYALLGILMHLSTPTIGDPLRGFDRYASLRFPLFMWAAAWAIKKGTARTLLICSAVLLALFTLQFSTWHVVGAPVL